MDLERQEFAQQSKSQGFDNSILSNSQPSNSVDRSHNKKGPMYYSLNQILVHLCHLILFAEQVYTCPLNNWSVQGEFLWRHIGIIRKASAFPVPTVVDVIGQFDICYPFCPFVSIFALRHELEWKTSLRWEH